MNELINLGIINKNDKAVVGSRIVAEKFEKNHRDVFHSIRELVKGVAENSADLVSKYFIESSYKHPQNKQVYTEYSLTRDGFSLLGMSFTGKKALEWKLKYIEAFN